MFLQEPRVLHRPLEDRSDEYFVEMRTADNVADGVYLLASDKRVNDIYQLQIER